jgi:aryl-alcohol dehydrogenase-like predicted oxidoreductase
LLAGVLKKSDTSRRADDRMQARIEQNRSQIEAWEAFCDDLGEEPAAVALAWLLHQSAVTAPIIGPRTEEQLTGAPVRALEIHLNEEQLRHIDDIWPGYQTAPEHFAW